MNLGSCGGCTPPEKCNIPQRQIQMDLVLYSNPICCTLFHKESNRILLRAVHRDTVKGGPNTERRMQVNSRGSFAKRHRPPDVVTFVMFPAAAFAVMAIVLSPATGIELGHEHERAVQAGPAVAD